MLAVPISVPHHGLLLLFALFLGSELLKKSLLHPAILALPFCTI